ncbi:VOC family protein [Candidatus Dojkabacteria bacterium]|nr:VOC family protein [Candidatus Dojkabacteria bacterium]
MKITKFGIHIKSKDLQSSYDFYKAFNLKAIFAYGNEEWTEKVKGDFPEIGTAPEKYQGCTFEIGNSLLEVADGHIAVKPEVFKEEIPSSKVSAMIDTDSIDEIVQICAKNNFEIASEPKEYYWGTREVVVKDPDGFILVFREPLKK